MKTRISELDGIRAIAVLGVLYTHFADNSSNLGHLGVRIFFVLSAFLITGILLDMRDAPGYRLKTALQVFYTHRAFRILPAYYLTIVGVVLLERHGGIDLLFHAGFVTNFWFVLKGEWDPWQYSALWTLSVEMQFYLVWPFVVLTNDDRRIATWAVALLSIAALYWIVAIGLNINVDFAAVSTPASFDALAVGALARLYRDKFNHLTVPRTAIAGGLVLVAVVLLIRNSTETGRANLFLTMLSDAATLYPIALLVAVVAGRTNVFLTRILGNPLLITIGSVSYGVYLYHFPILALALKLAERGWGIPVDPSLLRMMILSMATFFVALLSWYFFEKPLQRFGRQIAGRFETRAKPISTTT